MDYAIIYNYTKNEYLVYNYKKTKLLVDVLINEIKKYGWDINDNIIIKVQCAIYNDDIEYKINMNNMKLEQIIC